MQVSVVVPVYNEEESLPVLQEKLQKALQSFQHEIIYVNDGSADNSMQVLQQLKQKDSHVRVVNFYKNYGQTAALDAGFKAAQGEIIVAIDADVQNDPADIPLLIAKIGEGYDVVSGWRKKRQDKMLSRRLPSIIANALIAKVTKVPLHDLGCTLKAYRREFLKGVDLYGEMHRFIPVYAFWNGAKIGEVRVNHFPRQFGVSKYNLSRVGKVILDLVTINFLGNYSTKPIYFFGKISFYSLGLGILAFLFVIFRHWVWGGGWISPLIFVGFFFVGVAIQFLFFGILAEIMIRTYYGSQKITSYRVKDTL